jgi:hypothetical protein
MKHTCPQDHNRDAVPASGEPDHDESDVTKAVLARMGRYRMTASPALLEYDPKPGDGREG